jgi:hypothetical protein
MNKLRAVLTRRFAAARILCANGAREGMDLPGAVYAYNHTHWYVAAVLAMAQLYASVLPQR